MAHVVSADVVVPLEVFVVLAHVPVLVGDHAVLQAPVMQYRQIKAATIPAHQLRPVLVQRVEEGLYDFCLRCAVAVDKGMNAQAFGVAKDGADDHHPLQVQRHEIALPLFLALGQPGRVDLGVARVGRRSAQRTQPGDIGNRFDVEGKYGPGHGACKLAQRCGRYLDGSTGLPRRRSSKCSFTRSASLLPISAIFWPFCTV